MTLGLNRRYDMNLLRIYASC